MDKGTVRGVDPVKHLSSHPGKVEFYGGQASRPCHFSDDFPQDILNSGTKHSFVHFDGVTDTQFDCTFIATGGDSRLYDVEQIIADNKELNEAEQWGDRWWRIAAGSTLNNDFSMQYRWLEAQKDYIVRPPGYV